VLEVPATATRQEKREIKGRHIRKKEIKLSLSADGLYYIQKTQRTPPL